MMMVAAVSRVGMGVMVLVVVKGMSSGPLVVESVDATEASEADAEVSKGTDGG